MNGSPRHNRSAHVKVRAGRNQRAHRATDSGDIQLSSGTAIGRPWKGPAQYHDVVAGGKTHHDAAWSYPAPYPSSFDRVGCDYSRYVAFDTEQVTIG